MQRKYWPSLSFHRILIWHFVQLKISIKWNVLKNEHLDLYISITRALYYNELLEKYGEGTLLMELNRLRVMCTEICKILNSIAPSYMQNLLFTNQSRYSSRQPLNKHFPRVNQTTYGLNSFRYAGAKLWNNLPEDNGSSENLTTFKQLIKTWNGTTCRCNFCNW